ncbi:MAG: class I adenylate-forming enzyme family protein [Smithella sp.]|jgi:long-chain acyl-CoA synthetase
MQNSNVDFAAPRGGYSNNVISSIRMNCAKNPHLPALICEGRSVSWAQMWERTLRLGNGLLDLGIKPGERLAIYLKNSIEFSETFVATYHTGMIKTPVSSSLKAHELAYQLNNSGACAIVTSPQLIETLNAAKASVPALRHIIVIGDEPLENTVSYEELIQNASSGDCGENRGKAISPNEIDMLLYTSGTTGFPKGAVRGVMEDYHTGVTVCIDWRVRARDVQMVVIPQYHAGACAWFLATLISGGTLVIMPAYIPEKVLQNIEKYKVNWLMMVPIMYDWLMMLPKEVMDKYDSSSLRTLISGGAPLHTPTKLKIKDVFKTAELNEFYGSTELGVSTCLRDVDQLRKERSVGLPGHDLEIKLFDSEGKEVNRGEPGILYSRGLGGFRGYWGNQQATKDAFLEGGWATVGDIARQDEDGYYYIVDRLNDMIITGGVNVYPVEIEEILRGMPQIQDVAVIGVPDEKWGESVKAIVVLKKDAKLSSEDIVTFCKERLAAYKIPKSVEFADAIPRTPTGKILKKDLRKKYWGDSAIQVS